MLEREDNREFAAYLLEFLLDPDEKGTVIFEESPHIQKGVYRSATSFVFRVLLIAGSHPWSIIMCITLLLLSLEIAIVRQKNPRKWIHTFHVEGKISRLSIPSRHYLRPEVIRQIFLEKVRLQAGMTPEEFAKVNPGALSQIIKNKYLMDFIRRPEAYAGTEAMEPIVKIARRWNI